MNFGTHKKRKLFRLNNFHPEVPLNEPRIKKNTRHINELCNAIEGNHISIVKSCIQRDMNLNARDSNGRTPLCIASRNGNFEIVKLLLSSGACASYPDSSGQTPLHHAAGNGYVDILQHLVQEGGRLHQCENNFGATPLHLAVRENRVEIVELLINKHDINLNKVVKDGSDALHIAIHFGHIKIAGLLLNKMSKSKSIDHTHFNRSINNLQKRMCIYLLLKKIDLQLVMEPNTDDNSKQSLCKLANNYKENAILTQRALIKSIKDQLVFSLSLESVYRFLTLQGKKQIFAWLLTMNTIKNIIRNKALIPPKPLLHFIGKKSLDIDALNLEELLPALTDKQIEKIIENTIDTLSVKNEYGFLS